MHFYMGGMCFPHGTYIFWPIWVQYRLSLRKPPDSAPKFHMGSIWFSPHSLDITHLGPIWKPHAFLYGWHVFPTWDLCFLTHMGTKWAIPEETSRFCTLAPCGAHWFNPHIPDITHRKPTCIVTWVACVSLSGPIFSHPYDYHMN